MRATRTLWLLLLGGCFATPVGDDDSSAADDDAADDDVADDDVADDDAADDDVADDDVADDDVADDDAADDDVADDDAADDDVADDDVGDDDVGDDDVGDDDTTPPPPVRFVALGDTGKGNADQALVGQAIAQVCAAQGCDFALLLGDNFYDVGVDSVTDSQWDQKFEQPYAPVPLDFYPVLGNHDGGLWGSGIEIWKGDLQVDYSNYSPSGKWQMPGRWYKHSHGFADFYALDTSIIFFDGFGEPFVSTYSDAVDDQTTWLQGEWAGGSTGAWRIAYGHHPYLSNGPHGNAGTYEGIPFIPYVSGMEIQSFFEANLCGQIDLYLCGHDHSQQWITETCNGTQLIISGAGASTSELEGSNDTWFEDVSQEGFVWIELDGDTMTAQFWNKTGTMLYSNSVQRTR